MTYLRLEHREQWDLLGVIIDCIRRYSSELSLEEQEETIKGIEEGLTDQDVKRYFTLVGAEKMRQYRRVLIAGQMKAEIYCRKSQIKGGFRLFFMPYIYYQ